MRLLVAFACSTLVAPASLAQDRAMSAPERLLEKMTGQWGGYDNMIENGPFKPHDPAIDPLHIRLRGRPSEWLRPHG